MDVSAIAARMQGKLFDEAGVAMTFRHPKTGRASSLTVVYATKAHNSDDLKVTVASTRPQYRARLADVTALNLEPNDFNGLAVTIGGDSWKVSSWAPSPKPIQDVAEIMLNLALPRS